MINNAAIFGSSTIILAIISFSMDRKKTMMGIKKGLMMFRNMAVPFLNILILVSLLLFIIPESSIVEFLGKDSGALGFIFASLIGSITLIPAFISYPIASSLLAKGASYAVVTVFMTTLMMVGIVTLPLEIKYFGRKTAILRNALSLAAAIFIGIIVGVIM